MAEHSIKMVQKIPAELDAVWELFSEPANLQRITPATMGFRIISKPSPGPVRKGQVIEYKVRPLFGIWLYWKTEITVVKPKEYFIDEQRKGPYTMWRHEHYFRSIAGGVEMTDIVHYINPLAFIGEIANTLLVKKKLLGIFNYRYAVVEKIFGKWEGQEPSIIIN